MLATCAGLAVGLLLLYFFISKLPDYLLHFPYFLQQQLFHFMAGMLVVKGT
jgi:hypothetical protein